jgi:L-alanine-DL-glutamate epimerase-like enolase superfamily enzyme
MACWDITAKAANRPLCDALGGRFGEAVALYNVVTVLPLDEAVALARELVAEGYRRLQVKVGPAPEADAERLAAVRDAVGPDIVLFADANGAFTAVGQDASCGRPATSITRWSNRAVPTRSAPRCGRRLTGRSSSMSRS